MRIPGSTSAELFPVNTRVEDRFSALMRMRRMWVGNGRASERGHCAPLVRLLCLLDFPERCSVRSARRGRGPRDNTDCLSKQPSLIHF